MDRIQNLRINWCQNTERMVGLPQKIPNKLLIINPQGGEMLAIP